MGTFRQIPEGLPICPSVREVRGHQDAGGESVSRAWIIIRTATRQESRALRSLKEAGFTAYCPMRKTWNRQAKERDATKDVPLLPGYAFVQAPASGDIHPIVEIDGVHDFVRISGVPCCLPPKDLDNLMLAEAIGVFDDTYKPPKPAWEPAKGEVVRATDGVMEGLVGEIVKVKGADRVKVLFRAMKQAVNLTRSQVELEPDFAGTKAA